MADITVTGSADFTKVTQGIKRIGAESDRVTKQSGRAGIAILDLSRGIEDFAVAGMRGALNNVPVFLQSLGAGAGIAGVATIGLVAINELTKGVGKYLDKINEAKDAKFAESMFNLSGVQSRTKEVMDAVESRIAAGAAKLRDMQEDVRRGDDIRTNNRAILDSKAQVESARRALELLKAGKTEEEGRAAAITEEMKAIREREAAQKQSIEAQRMATAGVAEQIEEQNAVIAKYHEMKAAADAARRAATKSGFDKPVSVIGERTGRFSYTERAPEEVALERAKNVREAMEQFNQGFDSKALKRAEVAANVAAKALEDLRQRKEASAEILRTAELENTKRTAELKTAQEILKIEKERIDLLSLSSEEPKLLILPTMEEMRQLQALSEASRKQWEESVSKLRIDGTGMLSSSGRIGGSGKEFQASIATINYQREAINNLRKIERNTRSKSSTYN